MSEQKKADRRYIGKLKTVNGKYGPMQTIHIDNTNHLNKDGQPNKYYKGALLWLDAETGKKAQIKQMSIFVPKDGMKPEELEKGYSCYITLNLEDDYQVTILG